MCPRCKSRLWSVPKAPRPGDAERRRKEALDFELDRRMTRSERVEVGFRLNELAREMRRAYLAAQRP